MSSPVAELGAGLGAGCEAEGSCISAGCDANEASASTTARSKVCRWPPCDQRRSSSNSSAGAPVSLRKASRRSAMIGSRANKCKAHEKFSGLLSFGLKVTANSLAAQPSEQECKQRTSGFASLSLCAHVHYTECKLSLADTFRRTDADSARRFTDLGRQLAKESPGQHACTLFLSQHEYLRPSVCPSLALPNCSEAPCSPQRLKKEKGTDPGHVHSEYGPLSCACNNREGAVDKNCHLDCHAAS